MASRVLRRSSWVLWSLAIPLCVLGFYRPHAVNGERAAALPGAVPGWRWLGDHDPRSISADNLRQLGTDDAVYRTYVQDGVEHAHPNDEPVIFTAVFHSANWKSVHPPQICIEGSGMALVEDGSVSLDIAGAAGGLRVGRVLAVLEADQGPYPKGSRYLSYYVYGGPEMLTGAYSSFFLHHLPKALLRRSTDGFLLRAETFVGGDELDGAEHRCAGFLRAMLPAAQELVQ